MGDRSRIEWTDATWTPGRPTPAKLTVDQIRAALADHTPAYRPCSVPGCDRGAVSHGWCLACYKRAKGNGGDPGPLVYMTAAQRAAVLEDATWLLEAGESVERVAARVGRSCAAVANVLRQAGHEDLAQQFDLAASRQKRAL